MKARPAMMLVTAIALQPLPLFAHTAKLPVAQPVALAADELPMTARFASLVTTYRNCVLLQVDKGALASHGEMADRAMSACALSRHEVESQLVADIEAEHPKLAPAVATRSAQGGMDQIDPMIESAALERAHARYARDMD